MRSEMMSMGYLEKTEKTLKGYLAYCGFGLFSYLKQLQHWESSSFGFISNIYKLELTCTN